MSRPAPDVFAEALALPEEERCELAAKLADSLDAGAEPDAEAAWAAEIQRRLARIAAGEARSLSMSEAIARMHRAAREG